MTQTTSFSAAEARIAPSLPRLRARLRTAHHKPATVFELFIRTFTIVSRRACDCECIFSLAGAYQQERDRRRESLGVFPFAEGLLIRTAEGSFRRSWWFSEKAFGRGLEGRKGPPGDGRGCERHGSFPGFLIKYWAWVSDFWWNAIIVAASTAALEAQAR